MKVDLSNDPFSFKVQKILEATSRFATKDPAKMRGSLARAQKHSTLIKVCEAMKQTLPGLRTQLICVTLT